MPDPLRSGLAAAPCRPVFAEITGTAATGWQEACGTVVAGRLPLLMLASIATAYESAMTEGEGKNTWRTDRYSPCPHQEAGRYLMFLASVGYHLSGIEQAVVNGTPYTGDHPASDALTSAAKDELSDSATEGVATTGLQVSSEAFGAGPGSNAETPRRGAQPEVAA